MRQDPERKIHRAVRAVVNTIVKPAALSINKDYASNERCLWGEVIEYHASDEHYLALCDSRGTDADRRDAAAE